MPFPEQLTDETLLDLLKGGDEAAFTLLYRRRQGPIYRFALHMTGDLVVAEDVTQEVFLALLTGQARYDESRGSLSGFLFGVARNKLLKRFGSRREVAVEDCAIDEDVLDDLLRRETVERVRRAVLSLPAAYR